MDELSRFRAEEEKRIPLLRDWPTSGDKAARYGAPNCGGSQMWATQPKQVFYVHSAETGITYPMYSPIQVHYQDHGGYN
jgi:hypothetical protein